MPLATYRSYIGIAKETTQGTGVAAVDFIPVKTMTPQDVYAPLLDEGMRGSQVKVYDTIQGPSESTYDFGGDVFIDTFGYPLAGVLGDVTTTGAGYPYTHAMSVLNTGQPKSYTISDFDTVNTRYFPGLVFSEVAVKWNSAQLLEYTAKATGWASTVTSNPSPSFSNVIPIAAWRGSVSVNGSALTTVMDGECTIKRSVQALHTLSGTQNPYKVWAGPVEVDGKLTIIMEDDTQLSNFINNSKPAVNIVFSDVAGATPSGEGGLSLQMSKCAFTVASVQRGKDFIELAVTYTGDANTTDAGASGGYSPIKATLSNAKPAGTFA